MSPVRSLDLERKEELLLSKQLRQSSTKILRRNLPTLIEASPDFSQKKLPYLPNLPPSVQVPNLGPSIHSWFDAKRVQESDLDETPLPSLCSTPSISRSRKERSMFSPPGSRHRIADYFRPDSRSESIASCRASSVLSVASRRSRSSSITFDLEDSSPKSSNRFTTQETRSKREKERRPPTKEVRKEKAPEAKRESEETRKREGKEASRRPEQVGRRDVKEQAREQEEETQAAVFAREQKETVQRMRRPQEVKEFYEEPREYSLWSCRRCTLENRLSEASCQACGGSRLSSIGEVHMETMEEVLQQGPADQPAAPNVKVVRADTWTCLVCTLTNPNTLRFCDACNALNPDKLEEVVVKDGTESQKQKLLAQAARIFGLALLAAFLLYFLINVVVACSTFAAAGLRQVWARTAAIEPPRWEQRPSLELSLVLVHPFSYEYRGLNCLILATFIPIFLYLISHVRDGGGQPHGERKESDGK